mgnify:CR=1 FL=1
MERYHRKYKQHRRNIPVSVRKKILKQLYHDITNIANQNGIKLILIFGTLLGNIRENELIYYDYDLDFGVIGNKNDLKNLYKILKHKLNSKYHIKYFKIPLIRKYKLKIEKQNLMLILIYFKKTTNI